MYQPGVTAAIKAALRMFTDWLQEHSRPLLDESQTVGNILLHVSCHVQPDHMAEKALRVHEQASAGNH